MVTDWFASLVKFPGYNRTSGTCWMCKATYKNFKEAHGRLKELLTTEEFLERNTNDGRVASVIFSLPGVDPSICRPDWMHAVDLGVTADICGHVFMELLRVFRGKQETACARLWRELQEWYDATRVPASNRYGKMKLSMFKKEHAAPQLSGKAIEVRTIVPFLRVMCAKYFAADNVRQGTICGLVAHLVACYECLDDFDADKLEEHGQRMAALYIALEAHAVKQNKHDTKTWRIKPKLHMFLHLCAFRDHNPRDWWCYADESNMGTMSDLFMRHGGANRAGVNAANCLRRWMCDARFPEIRVEPAQGPSL